MQHLYALNGSISAAHSCWLYLLLFLVLSTSYSCLIVLLFLCPCSSGLKSQFPAAPTVPIPKGFPCPLHQPAHTQFIISRNTSGRHAKCYFAHDCIAIHSPDVDKAVIPDYIWTEVVVSLRGLNSCLVSIRHNEYLGNTLRTAVK